MPPWHYFWLEFGMLTYVLYCPRLVLCRSGGEVVRGYDFLVNAVWPEIISNIEARVPSIFAPGNPEVFHTVSVYILLGNKSP